MRTSKVPQDITSATLHIWWSMKAKYEDTWQSGCKWKVGFEGHWNEYDKKSVEEEDGLDQKSEFLFLWFYLETWGFRLEQEMEAWNPAK